MSLEEKLQMGPKPGLAYPLQVIYCGNCTMPIEVSVSLIFANSPNPSSTASTIPNTTSANSGWNEIYPTNSRKWRSGMKPTRAEAAKKRRNARNAGAKAWSKLKRRRTGLSKCACREHQEGKRSQLLSSQDSAVLVVCLQQVLLFI